MVPRKLGFYNVTAFVVFFYQIHSIISECVDGNYYSNESDCGAFYQCSNGELIEQKCPNGLYFNPELNVCDYPENVQCGGTVEPTTTGQSTIPTPNTPPAQQPPFDPNTLGMQWSSGGLIAGKLCVQIVEIADPHTWNDNYLCFNQDYGVRWSSGGTIEGMKCTQLLEVADPHTWNDNYLCAPNNSPFQFRWSSSAPIPNLYCIQMSEPADPHTWNDNYLCVSE